ncbi:DUF3782 domain-containing protein [Stygiolobus caldivivus]|uniref:DUF3782 domain-containing protein n=1 Tax=Stygiolobus caldivivus TaxID=2824673 RepID=A0A8D5U3T7_9CREN|nr:DUF3782 domain-containing protein [Stygiolobus caldivivus]BCU68861.1 hypothetical protein KN1_01580 [Stygiolobus caldivivus]
MSEKIIEEILNNPQLLSALAEKVYERLKDEMVIKKLDEYGASIRTLQEEVKKLTEAVVTLQEEVKRQGEAIKSLQQAVEKQGEAIVSLQKTVDKHTEAITSLQEEGKKLTEAVLSLQKTVEKQGEAIMSLQGEVKKLTETVDKHGEAIASLQQEVKKLSTEIGGFTMRAGKGIERTILEVYKEALKLHGIDPSKVVHGVIVDDLGIVSKGRAYEVDFYETDDYVYVFEVKNFADEDTLDQIDIRRKLFSAKYPDKRVKVFLVANFILKRVKEELEKEGVEVIYSHIISDY